ncbi:MAG: hypothetical protein E7Z73_09790 [Methanobrevibacter millerae]|uniref:Uncharacterized protein n=1 Tax=Methanobrevibacter millerae TaxID=230361 RepID=A0A8T3VHP4_9EURY|nr:hypothetical protein [Methanobrevibacter millerae]MBE6506005.1 hypothetical protein [Methanobrevibacter millerae]
MKNLKILIIPLILFLTIAAISAHGVDVTADTMVIANETNGQLVKDIADANGKNISVYKFTSEDEVAHILEHSLNNTNKRILLVAYQDTANDFLKNHKEVSNRIIVVDNVTNDTILQGLNNIMNAPTGSSQEGNSFGLPLAIGIVIGLIVGVGCGILILKKKN